MRVQQAEHGAGGWAGALCLEAWTTLAGGWGSLCPSFLHHMTSASLAASLLFTDAYSKLTACQHEPQVLPASPADAADECRPAWQGVCGEQGKAAAVPIPVPNYAPES